MPHDRLPLTKTAADLDRFLDGRKIWLDREIENHRFDIMRIEAMGTISEATQRAIELRPFESDLDGARRRLNDVGQAGLFGKIGAPVASTKAWLAVRKAESALDDAKRALDEPTTSARRAASIAAHNRHVAEERGRLAQVKSALAAFRQQRADWQRFFDETREAVAACHGNGWTAGDFADHVERMVAQALGDDLESAREHLADLRFQRRPAEAHYEHCVKEAWTMRTAAYREFLGMPALGAYGGVAEPSIEAGCRNLRAGVGKALMGHPQLPERWQAFSAALSEPRCFTLDALWPVYWAMFRTGQYVAGVTTRTDVHEDILNGKFTGQIESELAQWAMQRIEMFGYPPTVSYIAALAIASKTEETRLGADIGIVVSLEIGDRSVSKVALLQAKKTYGGFANIGSDSGQLTKLAATPEKGFYLFYHQGNISVNAPSPTVCPADRLADRIRGAGQSLDAASLKIDAHQSAWDWASFVTFGLCDPASGIGEHFTTPEDALSRLGGGDPKQLPTYLYLIAISDEPRVRALDREVRKHYHELERALKQQKKQQPKRDKGQDQEGPQLTR